MSYLLTEIALEMLGYKFYDTNGVFHLTNFQQSTANAQADLHPDEPSLIEFINQPDDNESEQNGHQLSQASTSSAVSSGSSISVDFNHKPVRALAKLMAQEADQIQNGHEKQKNMRENAPATNASAVILPKKHSQNRRTPAKALAKIMHYERNNIRNQLKKRLESANKNGDRKHLEDCLKMEKKKLLADVNDMNRFRVFLEERLRRIDSRPHDTYLRTFGAD